MAIQAPSSSDQQVSQVEQKEQEVREEIVIDQQVSQIEQKEQEVEEVVVRKQREGEVQETFSQPPNSLESALANNTKSTSRKHKNLLEPNDNQLQTTVVSVPNSNSNDSFKHKLISKQERGVIGVTGATMPTSSPATINKDQAAATTTTSATPSFDLAAILARQQQSASMPKQSTVASRSNLRVAPANDTPQEIEQAKMQIPKVKAVKAATQKYDAANFNFE